MSRATGSNYKSDLIIAAVVVAAVWSAGIFLNLFEVCYDILHSNEQWQLDEALLALLSFSLVAFWFSFRRWQEAIKESEKSLKSEVETLRYQDIANNMRVGLHVYQLEDLDDDSSLRLIDNNPASSEFTGFDISLLIGKTIDEAFPDIRSSGLPHQYAEVVRTGTPFTIDEVEYGDERVERSTFAVQAFALPEQCVGVLFENTTERSRTTKALQKSETMHEVAQEVAQLGHWELDLTNNNLFWSNENYYIFGVEPGEVNTYETFLERVHPDDLDFVNSAYTTSVESRTEYDIEHRLLMLDGTVKWVQEKCQTEYEDGIAVRSVGTVQDITKRKLVELEMIASRDRFSSIVEMAADAIVSINQHQEIILFNRAAEMMFGYTEADLLGKHVDQLIPEKFKEGHSRGVEAFKKENSNIMIHRRSSGIFGLRKSGEEFPVEISISKVVVEDDTIMTVMIRDLSDQVKAQAEQRKLLMAISEAGEAILITDRNAVIEYVNPAFCQITGYQPDEVLGRTPSMLKSHAQDPSFYKELWETITAGEVWHGTLIDRRKDGSFYPALMNVAPIHDESGEITHFVSLQQDMTEHEKLEAQFMQAQKMEAIGTLVGGIAHDFNNMLAALQGNVYLAKRKIDEPAVVADKLEKVEKLSVRAADMVHQLLTFARKDMVELRSIHLNAFIKEGLKLACSAIPENIRVSKSVTEQSMLIKGDATQLQQVVMNLLNNARDAVADSENPCITASLELYGATQEFQQKYPELKGDQLAHLSVQDSGCGIPSDLIDKVVEPFFTTKGVGKGTGLGLAMVYGAVQTHGGVLEIDSEAGQGTTMHIYLPLLQEQRSEEREVEEEAVAGSGQMVLLVDDDEVILETVAEVLRSLGYLVVEAANGVAALDYYRDHQDEIAILLSDMVMPEMGGVELIQQVRKLNSDIPVILMTGYDFSGRSEEVDQFDNFELLNKPVAIQELSQLMHTMMASK
ncbi:PAS domain S-box protein [Mariprofundus sp. NF]|uniref:hybrid sensor histidine kinase/response regulator n=1 Tax=Mariprofundus sp. NF TaxID=2608716 RepID=UPI0015A24AB2|nr:PAS domain S-box protein [Mariprofundus sp. NF]NWF37867.1 PAS domain S-box protein [Mariprofundus sp. NF]